jgi:hypothetical protein
MVLSVCITLISQNNFFFALYQKCGAYTIGTSGKKISVIKDMLFISVFLFAFCYRLIRSWPHLCLKMVRCRHLPMRTEAFVNCTSILDYLILHLDMLILSVRKSG